MAAPVRARDLQHNIKEHGFERGVVVTLTGLLDEYAEHRQHMREMVALVSTCVARVEAMIDIGHELSRRVEQMKRERDQGEAIE